jgi:DNA-nicking Smr family endonuclease
MKKRDLTEEERLAWLEENGHLPKATTKKSAPIPIAESKKPPSRPALDLGARHIENTRTTATIDATIDLHGQTQEQAHARVTRFVKSAATSGHKTLLIITGKSGVLRTVVPKWLDTPSLRPFILAITCATPKEGGEGALRVLLKKQK